MINKDDFARENLSTLVVEYIKQNILLGNCQEGDRILEADIAKELGISRAPVREGINELKNHGMLVSIPRKGNFVATLSLKDLKEIFDIRILLEDYVLEKIINEDLLNQEDFQNITMIVNQMVEIAREQGNLTSRILKVNEMDMEFHKYLWHKSGSNRIVKILLDLYYQLQMAMVIDTRLTDNLEETASDHYDIITCLKEKDLSRCVNVLKNHIKTYKLYKESLKFDD
ncbi:MAG: GntR family transcriptional regulator [Syntrophomonadaceae bacterium]|nr:GntR family transcriptional regulator [Syntrophomonadaceae bacterium]